MGFPASIALVTLLAAASGAGATSTSATAGGGYTFREAPINAMGVRGLADLRGKPVLIDFWGTR
jgi:hypothetical protein